jgi:hypothetical protein
MSPLRCSLGWACWPGPIGPKMHNIDPGEGRRRCSPGGGRLGCRWPPGRSDWP